MTGASDDRARLAERARKQAAVCSTLGSPLYATLLEAVATDVERGGTCWQVLRTTLGDPPGSARMLRFMGSVHRLVLEGAAPDLARFYPSAGGHASEGVEDAFLATVERTADRLVRLVREPLQTNEVGRSAALVGGFLEVARGTGAELRVLELGASAGLNLRWDRFFYEARGATWGDPDSPVRLCSYNSDRPLPFEVSCTVVERRGCDPHPLDPISVDDARALTSFVWPDQHARLRMLRAALEVARRVPATVDRASAAGWLVERLEEPQPAGVATVVFHSIVMQYLPEGERAETLRAIETAGAAATAATPLAWLRMEPAGSLAHVHLTVWPGGRERLIASAGFHGTSVRWLA